MVLFNGNPITMTPPNHVVMKVEFCEPGAKGDTATNVTKPVKVETGAEFQAPIFINMGDVIKIDTRTGEYVERMRANAEHQRTSGRTMSDHSRDFRPTASWEILRQRAAACSGACGSSLIEHGFLEVETPLLSHDTVVDRHLDPLRVTSDNVAPEHESSPARASELWLQTSPEFGMKRLLAAGGEAIYQVTRAFRGGERGPLHNPEFTMVEWYRAVMRCSRGWSCSTSWPRRCWSAVRPSV